MWAGQLDYIEVTKHKLELKIGSVPKNRMIYRQVLFVKDGLAN